MSTSLAFLETTPRSWEQAKLIGKSLSRYVFRGHACSNWPLKTAIERATEQQQKDLTDQAVFESMILRMFKSRAHHFIPSPPDDNELVEWLALIQDYGGPTRLLDFTRSFYIASFFAAETAVEDACVWAISIDALFIKESEMHQQHREASTIRIAEKYIDLLYRTISFSELPNLILAIEPSRVNERLAIQKGLFLFPCNIGKGFEYNLCKTFDYPFDTLQSSNATIVAPEEIEKVEPYHIAPWHPAIIKINLPKKSNLETIRDLYSMNIDSASLFPGLDGFARSLRFIVLDTEIG